MTLPPASAMNSTLPISTPSMPCISPTPTSFPVVTTSTTDSPQALLDSLLGSSSSIYSILTAHLLTDPSLPPLSAFSSMQDAQLATILQGSPALAPSKVLNTTLSTLVEILTTPRPQATTNALLALASTPSHAARAAAIRTVASAAEREMEISYGALMRTCALRGDSTDAVLGSFIYIENYEWLCEAEAGILQRGMGIAPRPRNEMLRDVRVAFCGSGPLPLSAILLHVRFGSEVVLVDVDPEAVAESRKLIDALERRGVLEKGALSVVESCAASARYIRTGTVVTSSEGPVVECDAVVLASLLPGTVKCTTLQAIGRDDVGPNVVLARSAVDLVDCFAYERTTCRRLDMRRMQFRGEWIPKRNSGDQKEEGVLGYIHAGVLNSVEVFNAVQDC